MTPTFSSKFTTATLKARITDLFNYSTILKDAVYANVIAKIGNSIFHSNTNYDSSADIVIGVNDYVDFDLPTNDLNKILNASYTITENVQIVNEVLYRSSISSGFMAVPAPEADNFTSIELSTPIPTFEADINALLDTVGLDVRVGFYDSSNEYLVDAIILTAGVGTLTFNAVSFANFANIAYIRIIGTNIYSTTKNYTYVDCPTVTAKLNSSVDCYRSQMTVQDCTKYPFGSSFTRNLVLMYPETISGQHVLPSVETTDASLTIGPNIWTGGYNIQLESVISTQQTDGLYVENTTTAALYPNVKCDSGLCALSSCIAKFRNKYLEALKNGSQQLNELQTDNIVISSYLNGITLALDCSNSELAQALTSELANYMNTDSSSEGCDCGCGSNETSSIPTEIFPLFTDPATDGKLVTYQSTRAYLVMQQVYYNGQVFLVISPTVAGESPDSARAKYSYIGGGIYPANIGANDAAALTATYNKTCGVVQFTNLTAIAQNEHVIVTITNDTIFASTDVEVYVTNTADAQMVIENKIISDGSIQLYMYNSGAGDSVTDFNLWFNNKA